MKDQVRGPRVLSAMALVLCATVAFTPVAEGKRISGTDGADNIVRTKKRDRIKARGGNDTVKARKASASISADEWTAAGAYGCTDDGSCEWRSARSRSTSHHLSHRVELALPSTE